MLKRLQWLICLLSLLFVVIALWRWWDDIIKHVQTVLGTLLGLIIALLILFSVAIIIRFFAARTTLSRRVIRIQLLPAGKKQTPTEQEFVHELQNALARLQGRIAYLERHLAFRDKGLSYFFDYEQLLSEAEGLKPDVEMELTIGPVKLGNLVDLVRSTCFGRREFLLQIRVSPGPNETHFVHSSLSLNGPIWYRWPRATVPSSDIPAFCTNLAHQLIWLTSLPDASKASDLDTTSPPEIHLLKAIESLQDYLQSPSAIESLHEAEKHLRHARRERWTFHCDLLYAIALDRVQRSPTEAVQLMRQLLDRYGIHGLRGTILLYNYGVATFHQYESVQGAYDEAIGIFRRIKPPPWRPPWRGRDTRHDWLLYLLAKAGIANCLAHQLGKPDGRDPQLLLQQMREINAAVHQDLTRNSARLGALADEVEWRLWNAEAVSIYFTKGPAEEGLDYADKGLLIHPENLPLRANRGSLFLLKYLQASDEEQKKEALQNADSIFTELETTGWDVHFVRYRLGRVRRLQQRWEEAIELLQSARGGEMPDQKIDEEINKAKAESTALDP